MQLIDYAAITTTIVAILRDSDYLPEGATVLCAPADPPTPEMCPAVYVTFRGFSNRPQNLVGVKTVGAPYDKRLRWEIACITWSAQSAADSARQCQELTNGVEATFLANQGLRGAVLDCDIMDGTPGDPVGMHAAMVLSLEAVVR